MLSNFDSPADAYIMLKLGEMSERPKIYVVEKYKYSKGKGWGSLTRSLGIKPGSDEFHAIKRGHDLHRGNKRRNVNFVDSDRKYANVVDSYRGKEKWKGKGNK